MESTEASEVGDWERGIIKGALEGELKVGSRLGSWLGPHDKSTTRFRKWVLSKALQQTKVITFLT